MQRIGKIFLLPSVSREGGNSKPSKLEKDSLFGEDSEDDENEDAIKDIPLLSLPEALENRLMDHQKIGVRWLHSLFLNGSGGILGDDMGLGKTFQVICLLAGLMQQQEIKRVLILAPVSVLPNWLRELEEHLHPHISGCSTHMVNSDLTKKKRIQILDATFQPSSSRYRPTIVLSSYQLVVNMIDDFANRGKWDYVVLDEGHVIKNPSTKTSKAMHALPSKHRLILTGTPIQNNLNEFWAIADWATKGKRFGTLAGFKEDFTQPIVAGQNPKATEDERQVAEIAARNLLKLTKPILLQRKKCELQLPTEGAMQLPTKVELVVWSPLATAQRSLCEEFLQSRQFNLAVNRSTCPVEVINHLKTVCRHPLLIEALEANRRRREAAKTPGKFERSRSQQSQRSTQPQASYVIEEEEDEVDALGQGLSNLKVAADGDVGGEDGEEGLLNLPANATVFDVIGREPDITEMLRGSIKLRILVKLVHRLHYAGHRTLIFSQSRLMLDIIQRVLAHYRFATHRIDGAVKSADRQRIIDDFNDSSEGVVGPTICLLTTKACGFGITLTGADRVIIYDPSWNPAEDRQAVDRAYRIGQTKPVVVYRLIMASSVEEKMYEKQVFKDGVRVVTESGSSSRYFSKDEAAELFTLGPAERSEVMERLWKAAGSEMRSFPDTRGDLPSVLGFSRHDTLYTEARPDAASQGEDPYAQFADAEYVPTDSEDEEIGVPPTPHPKIRKPAAVEHHSQPSGGSGKENTHYAINRTPRPPPRETVKGEPSEFIDLVTPPPVKSTSSPSVKVEGVDPVYYAALQAAKLHSPAKTATPTAPPTSSSAPRSPGPAALHTPTGGISPGMWGEAEVSAYQSLRSSKLHPAGSGITPLGSPAGRWSLPDRVSMLTEPSMYGDMCDVFGDLEKEVDEDQDAAVEEASKSAAASAAVGRRATLVLPEGDADLSEDDDEATADKFSPAESQEGPCQRSPGQGTPQQTDSPPRGGDDDENCVSSGPVAMNLSACYEHNAVSAQEDAEEGHYRDDAELQGERVDQHELGGEVGEVPLRSPVGRKSFIPLRRESTANMTLVDGDDYTAAPSLVGTLCSAATSSPSSSSSSSSRGPSTHTPAAGSCNSGGGNDAVLLQAESWSDREDEGDEVENAVENATIVSTPERSIPLASTGPADCVGVNDEFVVEDAVAESSTPVKIVEPPGSADCSPNALKHTPGTCVTWDEESGCSSGFYGPRQSDVITGSVAESGPARTGFLLNTLREMGSMKRTASVSTAASFTAPVPSSQPTLEGSEHPADQNSEVHAASAAADPFASPSRKPGDNGKNDVSPHTLGFTVRKRGARLSNYMDPDIFASPAWMAPSLFSPDANGRRHSGASAASPESRRITMTPGGTVGDANDGDSLADSAAADQEPEHVHETSDVLADLQQQVHLMSLSEPAAVTTPKSKISFQTAAGALSSMVVTAKSVSKAPVSFADLSSSDSDTEGSYEEYVFSAGDGVAGRVGGSIGTPLASPAAVQAATSSNRSASKTVDCDVQHIEVDNACAVLFGDEERGPALTTATSPPVGTAPEAGLKVLRPLAGLTFAARQLYWELLEQGKQAEDGGDQESAAQHYCEALAICDEHLELHRKLARLLAMYEAQA